jgi:hypothetical protein
MQVLPVTTLALTVSPLWVKIPDHKALGPPQAMVPFQVPATLIGVGVAVAAGVGDVVFTDFLQATGRNINTANTRQGMYFMAPLQNSA